MSAEQSLREAVRITIGVLSDSIATHGYYGGWMEEERNRLQEALWAAELADLNEAVEIARSFYERKT